MASSLRMIDVYFRSRATVLLFTAIECQFHYAASQSAYSCETENKQIRSISYRKDLRHRSKKVAENEEDHS